MSASAHGRMARNNAWANATLHAACRALPEVDWMRPVPSFFGSLAAVLDHIQRVDLYYLAALEGVPRPYSAFEEPVRGAADLAAAQAEVDRRLIAVADALDPEAVLRTVHDGGEGEEVAGDLFLHLIQHQIHHRGQAHGILSQLGAAPPQLDDFYLRHGRVPSAEAWWR